MMRILITGDSNFWELTIGNSAGFSRNFEMPLTCGFLRYASLAILHFHGCGAYFCARHSLIGAHDKHFMVPYFPK